jgi:hypothetical protein
LALAEDFTLQPGFQEIEGPFVLLTKRGGRDEEKCCKRRGQLSKPVETRGTRLAHPQIVWL